VIDVRSFLENIQQVVLYTQMETKELLLHCLELLKLISYCEDQMYGPGYIDSIWVTLQQVNVPEKTQKRGSASLSQCVLGQGTSPHSSCAYNV